MRWLIVIGVALVGSSCVVRAAPYGYATAITPFEVENSPPPPQVEMIGVAPSPNHFWVNGHWVWHAHGWRWQPGHWASRRAGASWVHPGWVMRGRRWVFVDGYWR